ncbi:lipopolysaccharide biosynthesis protein [Salinisphaera sp.]|uniref:lipopolysaccharide biosynthesis protein n=1 Tax=Salinisphaera sp. TaxID=1914330 RepID=UPI002D77A6EA|nr:lipopolysaccharide biosynthesis protein [Salinisphaera sp.]HET7314557.1 lipopolysaccharide biosynthesis protein [Salinisphaera sp.]
MPNLNPLRLLRRSNAQRPSVRGALVFSTAQQYTNFLITFPTIMILSRLLTPAEVGVYSVSVTFVNIVHMLRDMGTSEYLVQLKELDEDSARTAFTINLIIAWTLALVLLFISPYMAAFFSEAGVAGVLQILSLTFLVLPVGAIINALLVRDMQFALRYKIAVVQLVVQNGLTIFLAWYGFSYYSPAWGAVAGVTTGAIGCLVWGREYRIRGLSLKTWRPVTDFGIKKTCETVSNQLGAAAPDFVIGRMLGMAQVGLFSRGNGLPRMFRENIVGAIGAVSYAAYARHYREGGDPCDLYLHKIALVTGLAWPCLGFASMFAYPIIMIFFGDQWVPAVPILRYAAIFTAISISLVQSQALLTAMGRAGIAALSTGIRQLLLITCLVAAATVSLNTVAIALVPTAVVSTAIMTGFLYYTTTMTPGRIVRALGPSALLAGSALIPAAAIRWVYPPGVDSIWGPTFAAGLAWLAGYLLGLKYINHPLWHEVQPVFAKLRPRKRVWNE